MNIQSKQEDDEVVEISRSKYKEAGDLSKTKGSSREYNPQKKEFTYSCGKYKHTWKEGDFGDKSTKEINQLIKDSFGTFGNGKGNIIFIQMMNILY